MKFGQLLEYNMKNIFFEKSYTKCGGGASPIPFSKKSKLSLSLDHQFEVFTVCFDYMSNSMTAKIYWIKVLTICFSSYKKFIYL